ncbi:hypothetical protein N7478_012257 [Penicillium angulare]|uniref:uncharacterized protein n=1 Tax=Penicillium angulare TaxID=116970 RepID=UPI00254146ED|nr:uncharacterized protein N7478_012257 [Penicillium angulare]KAJ5259276.1 hypothetical protein N7478_012257 [Penicillium angulare]
MTVLFNEALTRDREASQEERVYLEELRRLTYDPALIPYWELRRFGYSVEELLEVETAIEELLNGLPLGPMERFIVGEYLMGEPENEEMEETETGAGAERTLEASNMIRRAVYLGEQLAEEERLRLLILLRLGPGDEQEGELEEEDREGDGGEGGGTGGGAAGGVAREGRELGALGRGFIGWGAWRPRRGGRGEEGERRA